MCVPMILKWLFHDYAYLKHNGIFRNITNNDSRNLIFYCLYIFCENAYEYLLIRKLKLHGYKKLYSKGIWKKVFVKLQSNALSPEYFILNLFYLWYNLSKYTISIILQLTILDNMEFIQLWMNYWTNGNRFKQQLQSQGWVV